MNARPVALIQTPSGWLGFEQPLEVLRAAALDEVPLVLAAAERAVERGRWAVGYVAYEAAPAFDPALVTHERCPLPYAWFAVCEPPAPAGPPDAEPPLGLDWRPSLEWDAYRAAVARVIEYIAAGDTYQVNLTYRLRTPFNGDPWALAAGLARAQQKGYGAWLDLGEHVIAGASPELFFTLDGERLVTRPMKGTAARGYLLTDDRERGAALARSVKDRAENLMIVDMVRNDLGRIAETGSVRVDDLYTVTRYETVWQMTSTVSCRTRASVPEIFAALFPCASVTGAPKVRTMQIIRELEPEPRGVYTGAVGYLAPGRRAQFNVAIRTAHIDRSGGVATYGVGGGVVWDSTPAGEWRECATKALILTRDHPPFRLFETILWEPAEGWLLLDRHLARLRDSAAYHGFACDPGALRAALDQAVAGADGTLRVKLLLDRDGNPTIEVQPFDPVTQRPWRVGLAPRPVDPEDRFLYHKTTRRAVYEAARAARPECDDVLLWNARREVTESSIANVVAKLDGALVTPPVSSGLLPGVFRAELLARREVSEVVVGLDDLPRAETLFLVNSLRRWVPAVLVDSPEAIARLGR